jgi:DNA mismatch repair ATPase MutS
MVKKKDAVSMLQNYFNTLDFNINKFGEKTILLWQCGGFYEVYALKNENNKCFEEGKLQIETVNEICNFSIVAKGGQMFKDKRLFMAGIPITADIERIIDKLKNEGFTIVMYGETGTNTLTKGKIREQLGIFSPGTHFNLDSKKISNNIMCIWLEKRKVNFLNKTPFVICGMSCIDIFTGKASLYEYTKKGNKLHNPTTFDDLSRFFSIYNSEELIFIHNYEDENKIEDIIQFASLYSKKTYNINLNNKNTELEKEANQFEKQTYQEKILNKFYKIKDYGGFMEITNLINYHIGSKSFCFLLNFIYSHNPSLVYNIHKPVFENSSEKLILANHSLHQLNIVETYQDKGKFSSLQKFLNKCITPMGKRRFNDLLVHPTTNENYLNKEYDIVEYLLNNYEKFIEVRKKLSKMKDIERLYRKIILNKVLPCEISQFYYNMETVLEINKFLSQDDKINEYIKENIKLNIDENCRNVMNYINKYLNVEKALCINNLKYEENFFKTGNFNHLDKADNNYNKATKKLDFARDFFSDLIKYNMLSQGKKVTDNNYIKIHQTEKSGVFLQITNTRLNIIKKSLQKN